MSSLNSVFSVGNISNCLQQFYVFIWEETWLLECCETIEQQNKSFSGDIMGYMIFNGNSLYRHNDICDWKKKHWKPLPSGDQTWLAGKYSINGCFSGNIIYKLEIFNGHVWFTRGYLLLVKCMNICKRPIFISIIYHGIYWINTCYLYSTKNQPWSNGWRFHIFHVLWCQI